MTQVQPNLGFIGTGLMGLPMSQRLLEAGFALTVWNRTPEKTAPLKTAGASVATSASAVFQQADIVALCLTDSQAVAQIIEESLPQIRSGQLIVDFSSISPQTTRELAQRVKAQGADWVDAPVSGGVGGAQSGQLAIMCGGEASSLERLKAFFSPLARQVTHLGLVGSGQIAKICNQMLVSSQVTVLAEVMALAEQAGIEAQRLPQAFAGGFADSLPLQLVAPRMAQSDYEQPKWTVNTLLKDLNLAAELALSLQQPTPMSELARQQMRGLLLGYPTEQPDPAVLVELYRRQSHKE